METLLWAVSKRVTLVTRSWDTLDVQKASGTPFIACAQPLGPLWAWGRDVQAGSVTPSPVSEKDGTRWSQRTMRWDHRQQPAPRLGRLGAEPIQLLEFGDSCPAPQPAGPHRVPLSPGLLLLEAGKLSPVVDGDEELPDEQGGEANKQDGARH